MQTELHHVSKKRPHLWLAITLDTCEWILIFFGRNVMDKVSNQKTLYYATSVTCASALPGKMRKCKNCIYPQMLY